MMGVWEHLSPRDLDMSRLLIEKKQTGNYGLAPKRWVAQLDALRGLPEAEQAGGIDAGI
jgi:hypothetical protein